MSVTSTRSRYTARIALRSWGLFAGLLLMMLSNGLLVTLIGLRAELEGFTTQTTGVVMASYYVGFLGGARLVPHFVGSVGHIRVFAALASLASVAPLIHAIDLSPFTWGAMRLITGFAYAGLYITAESWINDSATNRNRGLLLSVYMVVIMGGIAAGQGLLALGDPTKVTLFVASSVLVSASVIPVTLSVGPAPEFKYATKLAVREIWRLAPLGIMTGLGVGIANGALWGLGAVYATRVGMSSSRVGLFLAAAVAGPLVTQIPIGSMSDRIRRRWAVFLVTMGAALVAMWAVTVDPLSIVMIAAVFLLGGLSFPLYSLGLSHINDQVPAGSTVAVSSLYVFVTGIGAIIGPPLAATTLDAFGPEGFFLTLAAVHAAIGVAALVRIIIREGLPIDRQRRFTSVPARAGGVIFQLARNGRSERRDRQPAGRMGSEEASPGSEQ